MTVAELPEYIVECAEGYKISLNKPITIDSASVQVLTMREPTVQDMLVAEMQAKGQSEANQEIAMFANLCSVAPDNIKGATLKDYRRIQEAFKLFTA
ncbi:hypothetical protein ABW55_06555 [Acinetobacter sp. C15]|uniref:phage tail assembly protein n=1 Tax=Acinetobacter TaxID=469 RepID=UPI0006611DF9|nr:MULTISPECIES: phage tail assembly protein [Acinetobacter]KOR15877.1 hypothetical protein ABW55_06555 [Acinetobacter sp. C15]MBO3640284.1 phage tail assembly protein [Acinetobacter soli]MCL9676993.1 phage tail assembly protein [Acinetobacter sp. ACZLY 512]MDQ8996298.1 phage tail assembly protein [Acinetobacter soli]WEH89767.1 phage tail assembly protein [Acinetobacter soli]